MSSPSAPTGWESSGTWDTHWTLSETGGDLSPKYLRLQSAISVTVWGPWVPLTPQGYFLTYMQYRASTIGGGDTFTIDFVQYQDDRTTITGTRNLHAGAASAAATWLTCGDATVPPANTAWGRFKIVKAASSFNLDIDQVGVTRNGPYGSALSAVGGTALAETTWTTMQLTSTVNILLDYASDQFTVRLPGLHVFKATIYVELDDGDMLQAAWYRNGSQQPNSLVRVYASGANQVWVVNPIFHHIASPGDVFDVRAYVDTVANGGSAIEDDSNLRIVSPIIVN